jgi:hypothetical protein
MWDKKYAEDRQRAGVLLDLLGYLPADRVEADLRGALKYRDPRLKHFAIVSLLKHNLEVPPKDVAEVATHAEMRNWLYGRLSELGKLSLYPAQYRTQAAFAESNMVNWLTFPTELNRVPDEIELMKVVSVDTGLPGGIYDYFVFRFRTRPPHWAAKKGWMAGWSGPFCREDEPTTKALGETFSRFDGWESKKPEEHLGDTHELMKTCREYHAKRGQ